MVLVSMQYFGCSALTVICYLAAYLSFIMQIDCLSGNTSKDEIVLVPLTSISMLCCLTLGFSKRERELNIMYELLHILLHIFTVE